MKKIRINQDTREFYIAPERHHPKIEQEEDLTDFLHGKVPDHFSDFFEDEE